MGKIKRNWWTADERFKKVHQTLRANYDQNLQRVMNEHIDGLAEIKRQYDKKLVAIQMANTLERDRVDARAAKVADEIARIRLEYSPTTRFGGRFTLWCSFEETMIRQMRDIKEMGPYILDMLTMKIRREFANIDFARVNPVMPSWSERHDPPRFTLFSEPLRDPEVKP
jgi:hypothetical protein